MKRVIMRDKLTRKYVVITKSIQNDCFVNKNRVDNIGFYELLNTYKKASYKIIRCYSGIVNVWGDMCDMNDLTSDLSVYDRYGSNCVDHKSILQNVIHVLTSTIKNNTTNKSEKMLLRMFISDICKYASKYTNIPMIVLKWLNNFKEKSVAITALEKELTNMLNKS